VSDKGGQFKGDVFAGALAEFGCDHRNGALGEKGSIAIIERLWRKVKQALDIRNCPSLTTDLLAERVGEATEPLGIVIRFALPGERRLPCLERAA
jgi:hypothetical protein